MPFAAGNRLARGGARPGSGPKPDALKQELQELIREAVPRDKLQAILELMANRAHAGDVKAAAFIFDRLYGRPVQHLEIDDETAAQVPYDLSKLTAEELETLERLTRKTVIAVDGPDTSGEVPA